MHEITRWSEEFRAAYLYRVVAEAETATPRQKIFLDLATEAESQTASWADKVRVAGGGLPVLTPDARARVVALFALGATLSLFTGRSTLLSGLRMLAIGAAASGVTFMIGRPLGVSVA